MPSARLTKLEKLLAKARVLPAEPGVYLMKDAAGVVIYVGKAVRLNDRVGSYFIPSTDLGFKKQPMLQEVDHFDVVECETEWEALLTENRLIKDLKPKFNVKLVDDKTYPYLVITMRDDFPGVYVTREPASDEFRGAKVFGPFASASALREAVQVLQRVFKYRTCTLAIEDGDLSLKQFRPCLLYPIKQCTAPCALKIDKAAYAQDIKRFVRFLESKRSVVLREMEQDMKQAAVDLDFERAAVLRDQVKAIQKLDDRGRLGEGWQPETEAFVFDPRKACEALAKAIDFRGTIRCVEGFDIAHLQGNETVASKVCFIDGRPLKNEYRRFKIKTAGNDDYASMREVVSRRYREAGEGHELYPDVILIDGGLGQLHAALEVFDTLPVQPPMVISLAKKQELIYTRAKSEPIKLGRNNPGLKLCQQIRDEAHRFAQSYHHLLRKKKTFGE